MSSGEAKSGAIGRLQRPWSARQDDVRDLFDLLVTRMLVDAVRKGREARLRSRATSRRRSAHLEQGLCPGARWHRQRRRIMAVYVDVIVDPDPAGAPFGKDVGIDRQGLQGRPSYSSCSCRRVTPSRRIGRSSFSRTSSSRIAFGEAVEPPVPQAPQQPAPVVDLL